jgi:hypothetical protein
MNIDKFLFWTVMSFTVGYSSIWVFNHINAWLGFGIVGIYLYILLNFIIKQFKNK